MNSLKKEIIEEIVKTEGGYVYNKNDSGGETNYGITKRVARKNGYKGEMRDFPKWMAFDIYNKRYLKKIHFDILEKLSPLIARELADTSVNMGPSKAGKFLQRSLNALNHGGRDFDDLVVDGKIGAKTIGSLRLFLEKRGREGGEVIYKMLNSLQGAFYITLSQRRVKDEAFVFGWFAKRIS